MCIRDSCSVALFTACSSDDDNDISGNNPPEEEAVVTAPDVCLLYTSLKIRFSYGQVGNDRISNKRFPYRTIINSNAATGWGSDSNGVNESIVGADNLAWEKSTKADVGIDCLLYTSTTGNQSHEGKVVYFII